MQDSRSQHQNRTSAWQVLRARLLNRKMEQDVIDRSADRRSQVSTRNRSDKIRTYNYPQDRVTDHRIGLTTTGLSRILEGDELQDIIEACRQDEQERRLQSLLETGQDIVD